jgi:uncharacterized protein
MTMRLMIAAMIVLIGLGGAGSARADFQAGLKAAQAGDYATALREWRPLAEQGHATAQYNLGLMYGKGRGVLQNYQEAMKWYRKAVEHGNVSAQVNLGAKYVTGTGVLQDNVLAHMWFNIGGANGNKTGADNRVIVEKRMTPAQIAEAQKLARECMAKEYKGCGR